MPGLGARAAIDAIYAAAASPERWPDTLSTLAEYLGASGGMVAYHPPAADGGFLLSGGLREDLAGPYLQNYAANPFAIALRRAPLLRPVLTNSLTDMAAVRRSAFFADILAPQKIEGIVALVHPSLTRQGGSGGLAFTLKAGQLDASSSLFRRLQPLVHHLARAVDVSLELGRRMAGHRHLIDVIETMPGATLLLNDRAQVTYANAAAEVLLTEADGLTVTKAGAMRLAAIDDGDDRALIRALRSSVTVAAGRDSDWTGTVRVSRPSKRPPLRVLTTPLPAPFHPFGPAIPQGACVLVQVLGSRPFADGQIATFRQVFGLTVAEARVASLIGGGLSAPEAARGLKVSLTTVKSHLNRCFDKTEVRTQVELARLLASMPPRGPS